MGLLTSGPFGTRFSLSREREREPLHNPTYPEASEMRAHAVVGSEVLKFGLGFRGWCVCVGLKSIQMRATTVMHGCAMLTCLLGI